MKRLITAALMMFLVLNGCSDENEHNNTTTSQNTNTSESNNPQKPTDNNPQKPTDNPQQPTDNPQQPTDNPQKPTDNPEPPTDNPEQPTKQEESVLKAKIDDTVITVEWENNEAVKALGKIASESAVTINMSQYGGFEQVGPLGQSLPHTDAQTTTTPGDIVLYSGNQIVVFYGSNSWSYTRLGKITDKSESELKTLLDKDNVTFYLSSELSENQTEPVQTEKKSLVVYFSVTHHTKPIAEYISEHTGSTLYEIVPEQPYTDEDINYGNSSSRTSMEQNDPNARPAIASTIENVDQYDIIYLGYPIWWGQAPKIMYTFLESVTIKEDATIVPFCTSGSSPIGSSATNLKQSAASANWLEGRRFAEGTDKSTVTQWVDALKLE